MTLDPEGEWQVQLWQLSDTDIQAPGHSDNESEGNRELSWIWRVTQHVEMEGASALRPSDPLSSEELRDCKSAKCLSYVLLTLA
jgi:hypothetical protein